MKMPHKLKKGDKLFFKNSDALLDWFKIHRTKYNEFVLQCGQGNDEQGYNIIKA